MHTPLHTPICDKLGIEYPIFLAGMGGVSLSKLVAAVSNAGGLGIMGAATLAPQTLREEIRQTRDLTDKPFAVDLLAPDPEMIRPHMQVVFEEGVKIFVAGLAVPEAFIKEMHERDMLVMVMCGKVRHAEKSVAAGADIVAAQGTEAGGHTGEIGGMALLPQTVDAVNVPVIAAGGLADGRGLVAALAFGAEGAIFGTRFIATPEAQAAPGYRDAIVRSNEADTMRTRAYTGKPARTIKTAYAEEWEQKKDEIQPFPMQAMISVQNQVFDYPGLTESFDPARTFMPAGQGAGMIHDIKPAADIVRDIVREAEAVIDERFVKPSLEAQKS
ncbi:MAG: nitronate monooxygenase [Chloroflexi bacterium]|nr:nitronate monooxygenase [Chloroflexota bacterium]